MDEKALENMIKKFKELKAEQKAIEEQIEGLKEEIKAEMLRKETGQQTAGEFTIRFTTVVTSRFDSKRFQQEHEELYNRYVKQIESRRFSVA